MGQGFAHARAFPAATPLSPDNPGRLSPARMGFLPGALPGRGGGGDVQTQSDSHAVRKMARETVPANASNVPLHLLHGLPFQRSETPPPGALATPLPEAPGPVFSAEPSAPPAVVTPPAPVTVPAADASPVAVAPPAVVPPGVAVDMQSRIAPPAVVTAPAVVVAPPLLASDLLPNGMAPPALIDTPAVAVLPIDAPPAFAAVAHPNAVTPAVIAAARAARGTVAMGPRAAAPAIESAMPLSDAAKDASEAPPAPPSGDSPWMREASAIPPSPQPAYMPEPVSAPAPPVVRQAPQQGGKKTLLIAIGAVVLLAAGVGVGFAAGLFKASAKEPVADGPVKLDSPAAKTGATQTATGVEPATSTASATASAADSAAPSAKPSTQLTGAIPTVPPTNVPPRPPPTLKAPPTTPKFDPSGI